MRPSRKTPTCCWLALLLLSSPVLAAPLSAGLGDGHWEGEAASREGKVWRVNLDVKLGGQNPVYLVDLVDYGIYGLSFSFVSEPNEIRLERPQPQGLPISFAGLVEGEKFSGEFTGMGVKAQFALRRVSKLPSILEEQQTSFRNGDVTLSGTVIIPRGPGLHPAIVCTHGSGPVDRLKGSYRSNGYFFARLGFVTLIYDKRGVGKSTGDFQTSSLEDLADDAIAGVHLLKTRGDVDIHRIGVTGVSQGGWISPLAAMRSTDVAFVLVVSPSGIGPAKQSIFNIQNVLEKAGYSKTVVDKASELRNRLYEMVRKGSYDAHVASDVETVHAEPWFALSELPYPMPTSFSEGERRFLLFEPVPVWEKVKIPVLAIWGELDIAVPALESKSIVETALIHGGNRNFVLKIFPNADHTLSVVRAAPDGWDFPRTASGSRELMQSWIVKQVGLKAPR
jgi:dipeptidyl aminopeptidase/acylaminoacyl peptidase